MGIKNLHTFLRKHVPQVYHEVSLSTYSGKIIAIDVYLYLYRYKSIYKEKWLNKFISFIQLMLKHQIKLIFVYDTKAPIEKDIKKQERKARKKKATKRIQDIKLAIEQYQTEGVIPEILKEITEKRGRMIRRLLGNQTQIVDMDAVKNELLSLENQTINVSPNDVLVSKELLNVMNITYYNSENEAETLCSYMCFHGMADAVLSNDTDVLAYGTPIFLTKFNTEEEKFTEIRIHEILTLLEMTLDQFREFCIMCGTDYNLNLNNIAHEKAFRLMSQYGSIQEIGNAKNLDISPLNHERVVEIFTIPERKEEYPMVKEIEMDWNEYSIFCFKNGIKIPPPGSFGMMKEEAKN